MMNNIYYVYIYLDPRKPGKWEFEDKIFDYQPIYIGYGHGNRINEHMAPSALNDQRPKSNKLKKIIECGLQPIFFKVYENLSKDMAQEIEKKIIFYFGRKGEQDGILTNVSPGGKSGPFRKGNPIRNKLNGRYTRRSKKINKFDLNHNFIATYNSLTDAARSLNHAPFFKKWADKIDLCCKGERKTAYGFIWEYEGTRPYVITSKRNPCIREVFQYDLNGNFLNKFPSLAQAAVSIGKVGRGNLIGACCMGKTSQSLGFVWFYGDQGEKIEGYRRKKSIFQESHYILFPSAIIHRFECISKMEIYYNLTKGSLGRFFKGSQYLTKKLGWKIPTQEEINTLVVYYEKF